MNQEINTERPRFKTRAHDQGFDLAIALPGVNRDAVEVSIEKHVLTVTGERKNPEGVFDHQDNEAVRFELKINLHEDLDSGNIKATHRDGVLVLNLQKRRELAPRKIDILAN